MKIYTCAFLPFKADESFFTRDSGLLCRALQGLGHESKVIMPSLDAQAEEPNCVIRASEADLRNPEWWRSLKIEGVAFIAWGFKENTPVILAARAGGVKTCAIFDSGFVSYPYLNFFSTIRALWQKGYLSESFLKRSIGTLARIGVFALKGLVTNYQATVQVCAADFSAYNSASSHEEAIRLVSLFGNRKVSSTMHLMGYPILNLAQPKPTQDRKCKVVAIARWGAVRHKRPNVLMRVAQTLVARHESVVFEIFGSIPAKMTEWHTQLPQEIKTRVILSGVKPHKEVAKTIDESQILYCPSATEGVPLVVFEALCGGCTVVGLDTKNVPGLNWAFRHNDGTPVKKDTVEAHVQALLAELTQWEKGCRDSLEIATRWTPWLSATSYANRLVKLFEAQADKSPL